MCPPGELNSLRACVPPLGGGECAKVWRCARSREDRLGCREYRDNCSFCVGPKLRLMGQTVFRPVAASSVALSSHCPRLLVRGADSGKYGGSWKGCISPRRKGLHVVVEDGWGSARFRPSATNHHLSKPPRVSPEPKRRRDNIFSQTTGSSILRRDDVDQERENRF